MNFAVTGAFGYTGKYIANILIEKGEKILTFTNHKKNLKEFEDKIETFAYNFSDKSIMANVLKNVEVLYNTYWIRFPYRKCNFDTAIKNSKTIIDASKTAGIKKIVHISITNASITSPFPYFKGKAIIEDYIKHSGLNYIILRPTLIFGIDDILVNNIAFFLKRFPLFFIFDNGDYLIQPVYVKDLAEVAVNYVSNLNNSIIDVAGPNTYSYFDFINLIKEKVKGKSIILKAHPSICILFAKIMSILLKDIIITKDEVHSLMQNLLISKEKPLGKTNFEDWLNENKKIIGKSYRSELRRHYDGK